VRIPAIVKRLRQAAEGVPIGVIEAEELAVALEEQSAKIRFLLRRCDDEITTLTLPDHVFAHVAPPSSRGT
jgi:hypothetical protein